MITNLRRVDYPEYFIKFGFTSNSCSAHIYFAVLEDKHAIDILDIGYLATRVICFFLLGIEALLLNAGLDAQALQLFWLILPLIIKISFDNITRNKPLLINKKTK